MKGKLGWLLLGAAALINWVAVTAVGHMFGWLIGSSALPIAATVAPLVFGLLAVVGLSSQAPAIWRREGQEIDRGPARIFVGVGIILFTLACWRGIEKGQTVGEYLDVADLLHERDLWDISNETFAKLLIFNAAAERYEVPPNVHNSLLRYCTLHRLVDPNYSDEQRVEMIEGFISEYHALGHTEPSQ